MHNNPPLATQVRTAAVAAGIAANSSQAAQLKPLSQKRPSVTEPPAALPTATPDQPLKTAPPEPARQEKKTIHAAKSKTSTLADRLKETGLQELTPEAKPKVARLRPEPTPGGKAESRPEKTKPLAAGSQTQEDSAKSRILLSARHFLRERLKKPAVPEPGAEASFREIREKYKGGRA